MLCVDMSDQMLALCFGDAKENTPSVAAHEIVTLMLINPTVLLYLYDNSYL